MIEINGYKIENYKGVLSTLTLQTYMYTCYVNATTNHRAPISHVTLF